MGMNQTIAFLLLCNAWSGATLSDQAMLRKETAMAMEVQLSHSGNLVTPALAPQEMPEDKDTGKVQDKDKVQDEDKGTVQDQADQELGLHDPTDHQLDEWTLKLEQNLIDKGYKHLNSDQHDGCKDGEKEPKKHKYYVNNKKGLKNICETGFNAGHSALRYLTQSDAQVYMFDDGKHDYARESAKFLQENFPKRLTVTWGDIADTLIEFQLDHKDVTCDLMVLDGRNRPQHIIEDLKNFVYMASPTHTVVVDDANRRCTESWCEGPNNSWKHMTLHKCVIETEDKNFDDDMGYRAGYFDKAACKSMFPVRPYPDMPDRSVSSKEMAEMDDIDKLLA